MNNYISSVEEQQGLNRFIARSYLWMIAGLLISAMSAFAIINIPALTRLVFGNRFAVWIVFFAQLVLAVTMRVDFGNIRKMENTAAYGFKFVAYSLLTGVTFAVVALVYTNESIVQAFITSAALFAILAIYGHTTKRDMSRLGTILFPALIAVVIASAINIIFFRSSGMSLVLSIITMVIFIGLTIYDTQKMKFLYFHTASVPSVRGSLGIVMALELYLDFINLFLSILRIFGRTRD